MFSHQSSNLIVWNQSVVFIFSKKHENTIVMICVNKMKLKHAIELK